MGTQNRYIFGRAARKGARPLTRRHVPGPRGARPLRGGAPAMLWPPSLSWRLAHATCVPHPGLPARPGLHPCPRAATRRAAPRRACRSRPAPDRGSGRPGRREDSQTYHTVPIDGRDIKYTATAGTLPIRLDDGKVAARMFFVAYTKDGEDAKTRPVSFLYNGGPGSATNLAAHGIVRAAQGADGRRGVPAGAALQARGQQNSLIDATDLVFVDAISTGYSRTVAGVTTQFHGIPATSAPSASSSRGT